MFDCITFADEAPTAAVETPAERRPWKIIVADDEPEIHRVTKFALSGFTFEGARLEFISAYSACETFEAVKAHPDAAVLLLDVVMESEHAGLDIVQRIREELGNHGLRIVLRTGQPGKAPETEVIARYDINDYREKTEMTGRRLATVVYACLRGYRDIATIEASKRGLEKIIDASASIFRLQSVEHFAEGVLEQLDALLHVQDGTMYASSHAGANDAIAATGHGADMQVVAATGRFSSTVGQRLSGVLPRDAEAMVRHSLDADASTQSGDRYVGVYRGLRASKLLYVDGYQPRSELDRKLLDLFSRNISLGFENIQLKESIEETQREIAYRLGGAVESRSKETANHVKRVAELSHLVGLKYGLSERDAEILRSASPLHDVGKVGIPDTVLNKPGKHTPEEAEIMKTHTLIGYELLRDSEQEILRTGGIIAREHHEKWDGSGYPYRLAGEAISLHGRITAAVDVFDALGSRRCYKEAWPTERIVELFRAERGRHFEPAIVDVMLENLDALQAIRTQFAD